MAYRRPPDQDFGFDPYNDPVYPGFGETQAPSYSQPGPGQNVNPEVVTQPDLNMPEIRDEVPPPAAPPPVDTTGWDVDHYGIPQYTAQSFGSAPSGWDPTKWADPTHQTPKYVWGRIYNEAMQGGDPNRLEPAEMQQAIQRLQQAYPGLQVYDDLAITPWGERIDIFTDFGPTSASRNGISWGVEGAGGGGMDFDMNQLQAMLGNQQRLGQSSAQSNPGQWSLADYNSGSMECNAGMSPQDCVDFYNRWRPKTPEQGGGAAGGASGGSASGAQAPAGGMQELYTMLSKLMGIGGEYNKDILNRRVESSRESMNRARSSQSDLLKAQLAERGLLGSGAETTAITGLEEDLGDIYAGNVRDIYADESERSDKRLMDTLGIAAGLSGQDAQRLVDWFNAHAGRDIGMGQIAATNRRTDADSAAEAGRLGLGYGQLDLDRMLGTGRLGIDNMRAVNDYNLGLGDIGLRRDLGFGQLENQNIGNLITVLQILAQQSNNTNQGYR